MTRLYEAVLILPAQAAAEKLEEAKKSFNDQVVKQGGKVTNVRELGKRAFGYVVKKQREGYYYIYDFELDPAKVSPLKKTIALTESILRCNILIKEFTTAAQVLATPKPAAAVVAPTSTSTTTPTRTNAHGS